MRLRLREIPRFIENITDTSGYKRERKKKKKRKREHFQNRTKKRRGQEKRQTLSIVW